MDDGTGCWTGSPIEFFRWFGHVYKILDKDFNLRLTFNVMYSYEFIEFLDASYRFINGILDTDLFYKGTDAHRYLNFNSKHPSHTLRSVVYSQFIRCRRIIIDQNLLEFMVN